MPDDTPLLSLPLILPNQAQKHVTHNEALHRLDLLVQLTVLDRDRDTPPTLPAEVTQLIKAADMGAAYLEATHLAGFGAAEARRLFGRDPKLPPATEKDYVTPWSAGRAEKQFLARFRALCG